MPRHGRHPGEGQHRFGPVRPGCGREGYPERFGPSRHGLADSRGHRWRPHGARAETLFAMRGQLATGIRSKDRLSPAATLRGDAPVGNARSTPAGSRVRLPAAGCVRDGGWVGTDPGPSAGRGPATGPAHAYRPQASADARPAVRRSARPLPSRVSCRGGLAASGPAPAGQPSRAGIRSRHTLSPYGGPEMKPAADSAVCPALSRRSHAPPDTVPVQRRGGAAAHGVRLHGIHAGSEGAQPVFMVAGVPSGSRDPAMRALRRGGPARIILP